MPSECDSREDRLRSLERLVDRLFRRHAVLDDVGMRLSPELLGSQLAPGGVERLVTRRRRPEDGLAYIGRAMRVRGIEPPRVVLDDLRYGRHPPSKTLLEVVVHDLGLHPVLHE